MRILKISYSYYPYLQMGGPPAKLQAIAEQLVQRQNQVTVLTANHGRPRGTHVRSVGGVEVVYLRSLVRHRTVTITPGLVRFCRRRLGEFDIVHVYGIYDLFGPVVSFFCRRSAIPYVLEPLGMVRPIGRSIAKKRLYHALFGRYLIRDAAGVIATSERERRALVADGIPRDRIVLRRDGIEPSHFDALPPRGRFRRDRGIGAEEKVILFIGRIVWVKGLDLLLQALAALPLAGARLVLVGPEEADGHKAFLMNEVKRLRLADRVLFTGPLFGAEKLLALVDADVLVLPSRSESFGIVVVEAAGCGLPVVVTESCGVAPYVKDRVGLVVPRDADALKSALLRLLTDEGLHRRFKAQGPATAKMLSWDEPVAEMEELYGQLTAPARSPIATLIASPKA